MRLQKRIVATVRRPKPMPNQKFESFVGCAKQQKKEREMEGRLARAGRHAARSVFAFLAGQGEDLGAMCAIKRGINCNEKSCQEV